MTMMEWLQLSKILFFVGMIGFGAVVLIGFGYLMGRKTVTDIPVFMREKPFDPGPADGHEKSELDDAFLTAEDYGRDE